MGSPSSSPVIGQYRHALLDLGLPLRPDSFLFTPRALHIVAFPPMCMTTVGLAGGGGCGVAAVVAVVVATSELEAVASPRPSANVQVSKVPPSLPPFSVTVKTLCPVGCVSAGPPVLAPLQSAASS